MSDLWILMGAVPALVILLAVILAAVIGHIF